MTLLFSFSGRISVAYFWLGMLLALLLCIVEAALFAGAAYAIDPHAFGPRGPNLQAKQILGLGIMTVIITQAVTQFAVMVKRCHDRNKSGWFSLLSMIPYAGILWAVVDLGILEGHHGPNVYGPDPQNRPPRVASAGTQEVPAGSAASEQVRQLKVLRDNGLITQEEFDSRRQQLAGA